MRRSLMLAGVTMALATQMFIPAGASATTDKQLAPDGTVPSKWDLPKPPRVPHPDVAPMLEGTNPVTASRNILSTGDGKNALSFANFGTGDIIVTGGTATGHAGEWDDSLFAGSLYDRCVWSANTKPTNGVQREVPLKYREYDRAWALWVPTATLAQRGAARTYCKAQSGEPYDIASSKTNQAKWYCSKLAWASYKYGSSAIDLDADGGYWVWPIDLVNDSQSRVFAYAD